MGVFGQVCRHCKLDESMRTLEARLFRLSTKALAAGTQVGVVQQCWAGLLDSAAAIKSMAAYAPALLGVRLLLRCCHALCVTICSSVCWRKCIPKLRRQLSCPYCCVLCPPSPPA